MGGSEAGRRGKVVVAGESKVRGGRALTAAAPVKIAAARLIEAAWIVVARFCGALTLVLADSEVTTVIAGEESTGCKCAVLRARLPISFANELPVVPTSDEAFGAIGATVVVVLTRFTRPTVAAGGASLAADVPVVGVAGMPARSARVTRLAVLDGAGGSSAAVEAERLGAIGTGEVVDKGVPRARLSVATLPSCLRVMEVSGASTV